MIRRPRDWNGVISVAMLLAVVGVGVPWLWHKYQTRPPWWDPFQHQVLHEGLKETGRMAGLSVLGAATIGLVLGTLLTIDFLPSRALIRSYVEVWRGLPIIVTMFLIYFALPRLVNGTQLSPFQAATVGLILWGSAQVAEATRGAVQSIPREQHEAASALGFGWVGRHAFVILPQAVRGSSHAFSIFAVVMAVFFVISFPLTRLAAFLEKRLV